MAEEKSVSHGTKEPNAVASLIVNHGNQRSAVRLKDRVSIGSSTSGDVVIDGVGSIQAHIRRDGRDYVLIPVEASSPVAVNGEHISGRHHWLRNGDQITIGEASLVFQYQLEQQAAAKQISGDWTGKCQADAPSKQFYYQFDGMIIGPVTGIELREAAFAGKVAPNTLVANDAEGTWVTANRVRGLFDESGKPLPHPPETVQFLEGSQHTPRNEKRVAVDSTARSADWYCKFDDRVIGPLPASQLAEMARSGRLHEEDLVRDGNARKWVQAGTVAGLRSLMSTPSPKTEPTTSGSSPPSHKPQQKLNEAPMTRELVSSGTSEAADVQLVKKRTGVVACPRCSQQVKLSPGSAGTTVVCPMCGGRFRTPEPPPLPAKPTPPLPTDASAPATVAPNIGRAAPIALKKPSASNSKSPLRQGSKPFGLGTGMAIGCVLAGLLGVGGLFGLLVLISALSDPYEWTVQEIRETYKDRCYFIVGTYKTTTGLIFKSTEEWVTNGSGIMIANNGSQGLIVTNRHVVDPAYSTPGLSYSSLQFVAKSPDEADFQPVSVAAVHSTLDLALLVVERGFMQRGAVEVASYESIGQGESAVAIGNPHGIEFNVTNGIVSSKPDGAIATSCPISPGNSGGPLVLRRGGRLAAINTATRTESQNLNFAIPAQVVVSSPQEWIWLENRQVVESLIAAVPVVD